jgi:cob(I)alamin adenosyltransferase
MKRILRDLFSIGSPKEAPEPQWREIALARRKVQELERRMRLADQRRYHLRRLVLAGIPGSSAAMKEDES